MILFCSRVHLSNYEIKPYNYNLIYISCKINRLTFKMDLVLTKLRFKLKILVKKIK